MQVKLPGNASPSFPLLVGAILALFIFTAARLRHGSLLGPLPKPEVPSAAATTSTAPKSSACLLEPGQCAREIDFLRPVKLDLTDSTSTAPLREAPSSERPSTGPPSHASRTRWCEHRTEVNLTSCTYSEPIPCEELELHVPEPYPEGNYSHYTFVVASGTSA